MAETNRRARINVRGWFGSYECEVYMILNRTGHTSTLITGTSSRINLSLPALQRGEQHPYDPVTA